MGHLLDGESPDYDPVTACGAHADFESRVWWLADPLWSVAGNQRRDEQAARVVALQLYYELYRYQH